MSTLAHEPSAQRSRLPVIRTHASPWAEQRSHRTANVSGDWVHLSAVSYTRCPSLFVPAIDGLCFGSGAAAATGPRPLERATVDPDALVAVTLAPRTWPMSASITVYVAAIAPGMLVQAAKYA